MQVLGRERSFVDVHTGIRAHIKAAPAPAPKQRLYHNGRKNTDAGGARLLLAGRGRGRGGCSRQTDDVGGRADGASL